ncbi:MAG TPA: 16S rRNA (adenine(1518)-N(6)/adenine(1519)-N(6))-dimethyltransferase RsmA [Polyangiaceae bacterium]|nr:16S rRNA (adenine(1518)-N(6)/adenine(1519)-N(6))-dimethyltransferase RsmA [Polyangiaceae bacterium]
MEPPQSPKAVLAQRGLSPKHHFGQNFLVDRSIIERIAALATPRPGTVIELGAGLGALTRALLERANLVIAIERDRDLIPLLEQDFSIDLGAGRLRLLECDAKSIEPAALFAEGQPPYTLCGNLPYQITGPLMRLAMAHARSFERAVFLVQLEVAQRLAAGPGSEDYGALSVFAQASFNVKREFVVRRGAFFPQPRVDSQVVSLQPRTDPIAETSLFSNLVSAAFEKRRKQLGNAWRGLPGVDHSRIVKAAELAGIDLQARGETLSGSDFHRMERAIEELAR